MTTTYVNLILLVNRLSLITAKLITKNPTSSKTEHSHHPPSGFTSTSSLTNYLYQQTEVSALATEMRALNGPLKHFCPSSKKTASLFIFTSWIHYK